MIDFIIPKSNPIPQGIFCLGVMFVQLDLSRSRRRRRWWLLPLVPAALWLCLPRLAAVLPAAAARADRVIGARYTARLDALQQENFALHQRLAASADAVAENEALRSLLGSGRTVVCQYWHQLTKVRRANHEVSFCHERTQYTPICPKIMFWLF